MDDNVDGPERAPRSTNIGRPVVFDQVGLTVQLKADRGLVFLHVHSDLDRTQSLLLPAGHQPVISGVSLFTRLGRLHSLHWALAYGLGLPAVNTSVRFEPTTLRYRRSAVVAPQILAAGCWVAAAQGIYDVAALLIDGAQTARVQLADTW